MKKFRIALSVAISTGLLCSPAFADEQPEARERFRLIRPAGSHNVIKCTKEKLVTLKDGTTEAWLRVHNKENGSNFYDLESCGVGEVEPRQEKLEFKNGICHIKRLYTSNEGPIWFRFSHHPKNLGELWEKVTSPSKFHRRNCGVPSNESATTNLVKKGLPSSEVFVAATKKNTRETSETSSSSARHLSKYP